jgi:hypothetical protein
LSEHALLVALKELPAARRACARGQAGVAARLAAHVDALDTAAGARQAAREREAAALRESRGLRAGEESESRPAPREGAVRLDELVDLTVSQEE